MTKNHVADRFLITEGHCTFVHGLPESVVAMLFGKFSRNPKNLRETLIDMIDDGHLDPPSFDGFTLNDRTNRFHERVTIGYGHKSVGDHAMVHFCLEEVSAVAERDFTEARLIAASSKSTRYVDFSKAGFFHPDEWSNQLSGFYEEHCQDLIDTYTRLIDPAVEGIRQLIPYDETAAQIWNSRKGWESATHKRGLDMVRDLLPMSILTNFGVTMSATGLREMLDKRQTETSWQSFEVSQLAHVVRKAGRQVLPVLLPEEPRRIPRQPRVPANLHTGGLQECKVRVIDITPMDVVSQMSWLPVSVLVENWMHQRGHHLPPDRTAELVEIYVDLQIPIAIHRDLGRHRMMTQLAGQVGPLSGFSIDPLLWNVDGRFPNNAYLGAVRLAMLEKLSQSMHRLVSVTGEVPPSGLQYACPMATMVPVQWKLNLRELIHLLGLRTTPQGHPSYRKVAQMVANEVMRKSPILSGLLKSVTNFDEVLIGRPG